MEVLYDNCLGSWFLLAVTCWIVDCSLVGVELVSCGCIVGLWAAEWCWNDDSRCDSDDFRVINVDRIGVLSRVLVLMMCCVKGSLKRSSTSSIVLDGVLFNVERRVVVWLCVFLEFVEWCSPVGCHRCSPIKCHRSCSLLSVAGAGVFCWCSEMLFLRVCRLHYCSYSSVVHWWKLGSCVRGGRIQYNVSMIKYTLPNHHLSLKLNQLSPTTNS